MSAITGDRSQNKLMHDAEDATNEGSFNLVVKTTEEDYEVSVSFGFQTGMRSALRMLSHLCKNRKGIVMLSMVAILTSFSDLHAPNMIVTGKPTLRNPPRLS